MSGSSPSSPGGGAMKKMGSYMMPFIGFWLSSQLNGNDPLTLWAARGIYALEFCVGAYLYLSVHRRLEEDRNTTELTYANPAAKGVKRKRLEAERIPLTVTTTVYAYDRGVFKKELTTFLIGAAIMLAIHLWFGVFVSLVIGICTAPMTLADSPLVQIHALGQPELPRPFDEPESMIETVKAEFAGLKKDIAGTGAGAGTPAAADKGGAADRPKTASEAFQRALGGSKGGGVAAKGSSAVSSKTGAAAPAPSSAAPRRSVGGKGLRAPLQKPGSEAAQSQPEASAPESADSDAPRAGTAPHTDAAEDGDGDENEDASSPTVVPAALAAAAAAARAVQRAQALSTSK